MYYAYVFGCNKYEPVLLFASKSMDSLKQKLVDVVFGPNTKHGFLEIIDGKKMEKEYIDLGGDEESSEEEVDGLVSSTESKISKMIVTGDLAGPAKDYIDDGDCFGVGFDWYITKNAYTKLYDYGGTKVHCFCSCRLSIFDIRQDDVDFADIKDAINEFIF